MYTEDPVSNAIVGLSELCVRYKFDDYRIDQSEKLHRIEKLNQAKAAVNAMQLFMEDIRYSMGDFDDKSFRSLVEDALRRYDEHMKTIWGA